MDHYLYLVHLHVQEAEPTSSAIISGVKLMSDSNIPWVGSLLANVTTSVAKRHTATVVLWIVQSRFWKKKKHKTIEQEKINSKSPMLALYQRLSLNVIPSSSAYVTLANSARPRQTFSKRTLLPVWPNDILCGSFSQVSRKRKDIIELNKTRSSRYFRWVFTLFWLSDGDISSIGSLHVDHKCPGCCQTT